MMTRKPLLLAVLAVLLLLPACATNQSQQPTGTPATQVIEKHTVTPEPSQTPSQEVYHYSTQAGDTPEALARRFGVSVYALYQADSGERLQAEGLLAPGTQLLIPDRLEEETALDWLLPDSAVIFTGADSDFDIQTYVEQQNGYLSRFEESIWNAMPQAGSQAVWTVAQQNSINPRLLLALLELRCGCVTGELDEEVNPLYLADIVDSNQRGLYRQLMAMIQYLNEGYYGWREGSLTSVEFTDGSRLRLSPELNAGTVALLNLLARLYPQEEWRELITADGLFVQLYTEMFGDPWQRAEANQPLYTETLRQPAMSLPYLPGHSWSYTGGPHTAWEKHGPEAAIDFNPGGYENSCIPPQEWVVAIAPGSVVRLERGVLVLDLDGDGDENTGWVVLYVHLLTNYDIQVGDRLDQDQIIGFPSCLGGPAESAHIHVARKYNGEWMLAGGAVPFELDGWTIGDLPGTYLGTMSKDENTVYSCTCGTADTQVKRSREE